MTVTDYWNIYVGSMTAAEFVWRYGKGDMEESVREYLRQRPAFFGIVRRDSWRDTFLAVDQHNQEVVASALMVVLDESRDVWTPEVEDWRKAEARSRAEARARAEADALAAAVARVEAEARARAEAMRASAEAAAAPQALVDEGDSSAVLNEAPLPEELSQELPSAFEGAVGVEEDADGERDASTP